MPSYSIKNLRTLYRSGVNISRYLRERRHTDENDEQSILYSYDLQAGSYIRKLEIPSEAKYKAALGTKLGKVLSDLNPSVLLDAGVGEATSLVPTLRAMSKLPEIWGFDISLSRILFARHHLEKHGFRGVHLFTGAISNIPLPDASVDVCLTVHSVEPNGGSEFEVLAELIRVTGRYLVMIEPSWELGTQTTRDHISKHGYVKGLPSVLEALGWDVLRHEKWEIDCNLCNEAALIVAAPKTPKIAVAPQYCSPISKSSLRGISGGGYFSTEDGYAYPVIKDIPCLLAENGILASHLDDL